MTDPNNHSMDGLSPDKHRIVSYLKDQVSRGERYVRSKDIGDHLGLTSKQVGTHLGHLEGDIDDISIQKWGRHRSTTWRIESTK